jgi:hypothetical protein
VQGQSPCTGRTIQPRNQPIQVCLIAEHLRKNRYLWFLTLPLWFHFIVKICGVCAAAFAGLNLWIGCCRVKLGVRNIYLL